MLVSMAQRYVARHQMSEQLAIILRTEGLIIIKLDYAWCMKLILILQERGREKRAYIPGGSDR